MKRSPKWILVLSLVIVGLLSGLCMAATQPGENAKTVVSKSVDISTVAVNVNPSAGYQVAIEKVPIATIVGRLTYWKS